MSGLFCKDGIWYISVTVNGCRYRRSLRTRDKKIAKSLMKKAEQKILQQAFSPEIQKYKLLTFKALSKKYFASNHNIKESTRLIYKQKIDHFLKYGVPKNAGHQNMVARTVNLIINWGLKRDLRTKQKKYHKITKMLFHNHRYHQ